MEMPECLKHLNNESHYIVQVLTKDSVTVSVDAVVYYRVSNATVSVANVENAHHSTRLLAQTTLRNILGTKNLHEILSDRESISGSMQVRIFRLV
jgi:erythrocyte band 7 integral membrane protein